MDRPTNRKDADARTPRIALPGADAASFLPASRQGVLELGRAALNLGPILITGDAGIGKTWLVDRLTELTPDARWTTIDLTPSDGPTALYRQVARGLGINPRDAGRLEVADALADRATDDERHALVIDEAHNLAPDGWEEIRVLANRLGQPDGFVHLILVGQTPLARRFATRALAAVEARLAAHLHIRPIDLAEAGEWLARRHPDLVWSADELEAIHRDARGNPGRLLRRSAAISARLAPRGPVARPPALVTDLDGSRQAAMIAAQPPRTPGDRPPLHVEDNAIEVGWSTDEIAPSVVDPDDEELVGRGDSGGIAPRFEESDLAVHDHYAALQAWREWAVNQEQPTEPAKSDRALADEIDEAAAAEADEILEPIAPDRGSIRAEGYQHFAPFGQLFTRLNPVREPESPRS